MMPPGVYILDDDAPWPAQRLTFEIYGLVIILPIIVYLAWHTIKNVRLRIVERGKYAFLWFYLCIEMGFIFRLLYCYSFSFSFGPRIFVYHPALYGIWCFFPPVLTTTASLFFLMSMLNSLDEVYQTNKLQKFGRLRIVVIVSIGLFWALCGSLYAAMAHRDITAKLNDNTWRQPFFYTCAVGNVAVCAILIFVTVYYISELKKFTYTYNDKKSAIIVMLAGTSLQIFLRILQSTLNGLELLLKLEKFCGEHGYIWFQIYTCGYFFLSDVVPAVGYILFLRKEIEAQVSVETAANEGSASSDTRDRSSTNSNVTSLLEKLYKKKEAQRNKPGPAVVNSNIHDPLLDSQQQLFSLLLES